MEGAKIKSIAITVGKRDVALTEDEARALYAELDKLFGFKTQFIPTPTPFYVKPLPMYPRPYEITWTSGTGTSPRM